MINESGQPDLMSDQSKGRIKNISAVVLTKNEEAGIAFTLSKLTDFEEVVVVDSFSDDKTIAICDSMGIRVVNFAWNRTYPKKKQWSLENSGIKNTWVLLLDADEYPSETLLEELKVLDRNIDFSKFGAYDINLSYRFMGSFLKHGHIVTKRSLVNVDFCAFPVVGDLNAPGIREVEGHYQPQSVLPVGKLKSKLFHDDKDPISSWFERHNRYSDWEAYLYLNGDLRQEVAKHRTFKGLLFARMPLKPLMFFIYSYILKFGFLDGLAGLYYATALTFYYWQIGVKVRENQLRAVVCQPQQTN